MTGWFGFDDIDGRECGVRLDHVIMWSIQERVNDDHATYNTVVLFLSTGRYIEVTASEDVEALLTILHRIEYTS